MDEFAEAAAAAPALEEIDYHALASVIGYAALSAMACELVNYLLVFRRDDYERKASNFRKANARLEKKKQEDEVTPGAAKLGKDGKEKKDKKLVQLEREFETANRDLMALSMRSQVVTAAMHMMAFFALKTHYDGIVLARLPFEPFKFIQNISHRNLPGTNPRDCGMIFVYMLCGMAIKPSLARLLGHTPPKTQIPASAQRFAEEWSNRLAPVK